AKTSAGSSLARLHAALDQFRDNHLMPFLDELAPVNRRTRKKQNKHQQHQKIRPRLDGVNHTAGNLARLFREAHVSTPIPSGCRPCRSVAACRPDRTRFRRGDPPPSTRSAAPPRKPPPTHPRPSAA